MTADTLLSSLHLSIPELIVALGSLALLMLGVFLGERSGRTVTIAAIVVLLAALLWVLFVPVVGLAYGGVYIADGFARFMKAVALIGSIAALVMSFSLAKENQLDKFEFPVLLVLCTLGVMLMISANDLIALYLGLELQSLAIYVIAAINRDSAKSTEAGLKYFVLGALSSGMLLYGMSLVYGFTGHTQFADIAHAVSQSGVRSLGLIFGLVFVLAGMAFKISAVPFHMWTPDVYEGAPTPVTSFMASAPKVAAMAMMTRIVISAFEPMLADWRQIIVFISVASMLLGSFAAIGQRNIKRLMAYSSIGHMGYTLVGLAAGTRLGVSGVILYMTIYLVMTIGCFAIIMSMRTKDGRMVEEVADLGGLATTKPFMSIVLTIMMFSLAGIPPMAGFFGKYFVFVAAVQAHLYTLAVIGLLTSCVGAYYYLRVVKIMWFDESVVEFAPTESTLRFVFGVSGLFTLAYVFFGGALGTAADIAATTLF